MSFYAMSALINFITSIVLGFFVLYKSRNAKNFSFFVFSFFVGFWSLAYFLWQISNTDYIALFWVRVLMSFAIFIPIFYLHFVLLFLDLIKKHRLLLIILYFFFIVCLFFSFWLYFVNTVRSELFFSFWPKPGFLYHPFLLVWFIVWIYASYLLFKNYHIVTGAKRAQIKYLLIGIVIGFIGGSTNYLLWYGIPIPPYGNILVSLYVIATAYSILAHHLFDIRVIIKKSLVYSGLLAFVLVTYGVVVLSFSVFLGTEAVISAKTIVPNLIAAILIALGFGPLEKMLSNFTDRWLFKGEYNLEETIKTLTDKLANVADLEEALKAMMNELIKSLRVGKSVFFVIRRVQGKLEPKKITCTGYNHEDPALSIKPEDAMIRHFLKVTSSKIPLENTRGRQVSSMGDKTDILITEELERDGMASDLIKRLKELGAAVVLPIRVKSKNKSQNQQTGDKVIREQGNKDNGGEKQLIGLMILGEKLS